MGKKELTVTELARMGGLARKMALPKARRKAIAGSAARERWAGSTPEQRSAFMSYIRRRGIANAKKGGAK